jgi:hypothetical protein
LAIAFTYALRHKDDYENIFAIVCLWLSIWGSFFMMLQFVKCSIYERFCTALKFLEGHERDTIDVTLHNESPISLTEKSKAVYSKAEVGTDLNAFAYKCLHIETANKMKYSLEDIMQA